MCHIQAREDLIARIRVGGKLNKEGREETLGVLLVGIPEIEVVIDDGSQSGSPLGVEVLDN
jgi:hypothetical protein